MPRTFHPHDKKQNVPSFHELWQPVENVFVSTPPLEARGNRPLQMNFEHQLKSLVFFHRWLAWVNLLKNESNKKKAPVL